MTPLQSERSEIQAFADRLHEEGQEANASRDAAELRRLRREVEAHRIEDHRRAMAPIRQERVNAIKNLIGLAIIVGLVLVFLLW